MGPAVSARPRCGCVPKGRWYPPRGDQLAGWSVIFFLGFSSLLLEHGREVGQPIKRNSMRIDQCFDKQLGRPVVRSRVLSCHVTVAWLIQDPKSDNHELQTIAYR